MAKQKQSKKSALTVGPESGEIPYRDLVLSPALNVRAGDYKPEGIDELVALIRAKGLIQPLAVRLCFSGEAEVIDGGRRYTAIGRLIASGDWPENKPVPCTVRDDDDAAARETSLVANISREPMHPVRELEVFAELHSGGADVASIAHRYGVSEKLVRQRLALGGLAIPIREAWRAGDISADAAQAFAVCRDTARQAKVFAELQAQRRLYVHEIRGALVKDKPRLDDSRLSFIGGVDAYKAAGGIVVETLFKDDGHLEAGELLEQLVSARMVVKCEELRADGWSFAVPISDVKGQNHWTWQRVRPGKAEYTAKETYRLKELDDERKGLEDIDMPTDEQSERIDAIDEEYRSIEHAAESRAYSEAQKKKSGCVVDGADITYGLVRPKPGKDVKGGKSVKSGAGIDDVQVDAYDGHQEEDDAGEARISNALLLSITEKQTVAAAKALAASPAVALAIVIAGLRSWESGPVKITSAGWHGARGAIDDSDDSDVGEFAEALTGLGDKDLAGELARAVSRTLDLRRYASTEYTAGFRAFDPAGIDALVATLPGDTYLAEMRAEFDAGDYFHRSPATVIRAAIAEMTEGRNDGKREIAAGLKKKSSLVTIAVELAGPTGWLPAELRHPDYRLMLAQEPGAVSAAKKGRQKKAKAS